MGILSIEPISAVQISSLNELEIDGNVDPSTDLIKNETKINNQTMVNNTTENNNSTTISNTTDPKIPETINNTLNNSTNNSTNTNITSYNNSTANSTVNSTDLNNTINLNKTKLKKTKLGNDTKSKITDTLLGVGYACAVIAGACAINPDPTISKVICILAATVSAASFLAFIFCRWFL